MFVLDTPEIREPCDLAARKAFGHPFPVVPDERGGSVCLSRLKLFCKWIFRSVMPRPGLSGAEVETEPAWPDVDFDLNAFAAQSFGIFQEDRDDVVLRFDKDLAEEVRAFDFHPSRSLHDLPDGRVEMRFTSGGLLELVRHLLTWSGTIEIAAPNALRKVMRDKLDAAMARLGWRPGSYQCSVWTYCNDFRRKVRSSRTQVCEPSNSTGEHQDASEYPEICSLAS